MEPEIRTALITLCLIAGISIVALSFGETKTTFASHQTITENEEYDREWDDYDDWIRQSGSSLRRKIDRLDEDPVDTFEIPVLFGITLGDLFPNFGDPRGGGTRTHEGFDMLAPLGTPIVSPTEAVVMRTGRGSSAGNYVYTANPGGETFVYMHLDDIADIDSGDVLNPGELIGFVGDTGNANGVSHLHFEVRKNRTATDPYPRITKEYALNEKMDFLEAIFDDVRDEDELASFLVETFGGTFLLARGSGVELPEAIEAALEESGLDGEIGEITRTLSLGDENDAVVTLQSFLIGLNIGPAAAKLAAAGATGYFGPVTQSALIEFQRSVGITPADGVFGQATRSYIAAIFGEENTGTARGGVIEEPASSLGLIATLIPQDLTIGNEGPAVMILQLYLIIKQTGPAARELFAAGATGYFGPITAAAFREFQTAHGIPSTGNYDAPTRIFIKTNG